MSSSNDTPAINHINQYFKFQNHIFFQRPEVPDLIGPNPNPDKLRNKAYYLATLTTPRQEGVDLKDPNAQFTTLSEFQDKAERHLRGIFERIRSFATTYQENLRRITSDTATQQDNSALQIFDKILA